MNDDFDLKEHAKALSETALVLAVRIDYRSKHNIDTQNLRFAISSIYAALGFIQSEQGKNHE